MRFRLCAGVVAGLLAAGLTACADLAPETGSTGVIVPMPIGTADGSHVAAEFGRITVPENRKASGGREIAVGFIRIPSTNPEPAEPVFVLPGGPGLSVYYMVDPTLLPLMQALASVGDVVIVGQRGNFGSSPHLRCGGSRAGDDALAPLAGNARQCRDVWTAAGIDLDGYNVVEAAADVEDLRAFLGYDRITLSGVSFGSHWALVTMREYPDSIARAFLGGVEGLDHSYDMPSDVLAAVRRIAGYAERDKRLAPHVPETGLIGALEQAVERLEREPARWYDSELDEEVEITADDVRAVARRDLSDRGGVVALPAKILRIHEGDLAPAAAERRRTRQWPVAPAFTYTIDCASGLSEERARAIAEDPAAGIIGRVNYFYERDCPIWDVADLGSAFRAPYASDIPVLIVQGDWDTATPIENLGEVTPMFSNATVVTATRGTHLVSVYAMLDPAIAQHILGFLATGEAAGIPESFDAWVPEFDVSGLGDE